MIVVGSGRCGAVDVARGGSGSPRVGACFVRAARFLLALGTACLAGVASAHPVWFADRQQVWRLEADTGAASVVFPQRGVRRIAPDAGDGSLWLATKHALRKVDAVGAGIVERQARELGVHEIEAVALNHYDRSVWVLGGHELVRLSEQGALLERHRLQREAHTLALGLDESVWVLSAHGLVQFKPGAGQANALSLRGVPERPRGLIVDSLGDAAFVAGSRHVQRVSLVSGQELGSVRARGTIRGVAFDPRAGRLWVLVREPHDSDEREARHGKDDDIGRDFDEDDDEAYERGARFVLFGYDRDLNFVYSASLSELDGGGQLTWDARNSRLWAVGTRRIVALDEQGVPVSVHRTEQRTVTLGAAAFMLQPTLALLRPPENALTNNPTPTFGLAYGADCSGIACGFPHSVYGTYGLEATLNAQAVGSLFTFDPQTGEASFTPATRLPEGENRFSAQASDRFAHRSNVVSNTFTVDTIPPKFLTLSPADGTVLTSPNTTIAGSVDEPGTQVVLENHAALGGLGTNPQGTSFSFPVILRPGLNPITLSAIDLAGNRATTLLHLTYVPVSVEVQSPTDGATVSGSRVLVSGTLQGPPNTGITVNGVVATIVGTQYFAYVPLVAGANTLTVVATTLDGFRVERSLTVSSSGARPIEVSVQPFSGLAPLKVGFAIANNANQAIARIEADFDGNGTIDFTTPSSGAAIQTTYAQPGVYSARIIITNIQGTATTETIQVVVQDALQIDQLLKTQWTAMSQALAQGDKAKSMQYLTVQAKLKYGPIFDALMPHMPQIVASYSAPVLTSLTEQIVEYAVVRPNGERHSVYLIYFVRDDNGVWRMDEM